MLRRFGLRAAGGVDWRVVQITQVITTIRITPYGLLEESRLLWGAQKTKLIISSGEEKVSRVMELGIESSSTL